jgi:hypothetical protein
MDDVDELGKHVEHHISALQEVIQSLKSDIANQEKSVSFEQVKEIEGAILRLSRQGLPIPAELKELKLKLFSAHEHHKKRIVLYRRLQAGIADLHEKENPRTPKRTLVVNPKTTDYSYRKPSNIERPLGSKGNNNLDDYLIPVIKLMWKGLDHAAAFSKIAQVLDVRYNTVSSQCTRALDLTTDEFVRQVNSKTIVSLLKKKYPDHHQKINVELNI